MRSFLLLLALAVSGILRAQCGACSFSASLVTNGNFSSGNSGFTTQMNPGTGFFCPLCPEGTFAVGANALFFHNDFTGTDHTNPPFGNFFIANGTGQAGIEVWCQTVDVQPGVDYTFSFWGRDITNNSDPHPMAQLQVSFNGVLTGPILECAGGWQQQTITWNSGSLESVEVCIVNQQWQTGGNDFGLDDISMTGCHAYQLSQQATAGADLVLCSGNTAVLGTAPSAGYTYQWTGSSSLSAANSSNPTYTASNTGTDPFTEELVLAVDSAGVGCTTTDTVLVTVLPMPSFSLGPDLSFCPGGSVELYAGETWESVSWSTGADTPSITVSSGGTYSASVSLNGCSVSDELLVQAIILPAVDLGPDQEACNGATVTLSAGVPGSWSDGQSGPVASFTASTDVTFTYTEDGCSVSDDAIITFYAVPVVAVSGPELFCEGSTAVLMATDAGLWNTGATGTSIEVAEAGYYDVVVANGPCTATAGITLTMSPLPVVDLGADTVLCEGASLLLSSVHPENELYQWSDGSMDSTLLVSQAGTYSLQVANACGTRVDEIVVETEPCGWDIWIPNTFTPDRDILRINEEWIVVGYNVSNLKVFVYNRLGDLVFYTETPGEGWTPDPDTVGIDTYAYRVEAIAYDGSPVVRHGYVLLLR